MLSATIDEKKAEIILPEEFPMIKSDPVLLEHIIYNFMDNALKFQPADQQARISISCETNSGEFKLIVSDNGIGIPPQYISKLFTPFQRLHSQDEYHGTGMGLAFVKKCTELMGGKAGVTSNRGEGSSFWVSFPISRKES
jgi:signal transduction histidine kinase